MTGSGRRDREHATVPAVTASARRHRDRGQATVEFALVLPVVALVALGVLQLAVVARDQLRLELAVREAARAASVAADPVGAAATAARRTDPDPGLTVSATLGSDTVHVQVERPVRFVVPGLGSLARDRRLTASATMLLEPPG